MSKKGAKKGVKTTCIVDMHLVGDRKLRCEVTARYDAKTEAVSVEKCHIMGSSLMTAERLGLYEEIRKTVGSATSVVDADKTERDRIVAFIKQRQEQIRHDDRDGAILLEDLAREIEENAHGR